MYTVDRERYAHHAREAFKVLCQTGLLIQDQNRRNLFAIVF